MRVPEVPPVVPEVLPDCVPDIVPDWVPDAVPDWPDWDDVPWDEVPPTSSGLSVLTVLFSRDDSVAVWLPWRSWVLPARCWPHPIEPSVRTAPIPSAAKRCLSILIATTPLVKPVCGVEEHVPCLSSKPSAFK